MRDCAPLMWWVPGWCPLPRSADCAGRAKADQAQPFFTAHTTRRTNDSLRALTLRYRALLLPKCVADCYACAVARIAVLAARASFFSSASSQVARGSGVVNRELPRIHNHHRLRGGAALAAHALDGSHHVHAFDHLSEHHVPSVQPAQGARRAPREFSSAQGAAPRRCKRTRRSWPR